MWKFDRNAGQMFKDEQFVASGYAGHGVGVNNPAMEQVHDVGPLPAGNYTIGSAFTHDHAGPVTMRLTPAPTTQMYGRDGMLIHGDNANGDRSASNGCIVLARPFREMIAASPDRNLLVV